MQKLYALLVGINEYAPESRSRPASLIGCKNDVEAFEGFLKRKFPANQLEIVKLLGEKATYQAVIDQFGTAHLARAGKDDTVLFFFSGHGSREPAPVEFRSYFPEGKLETLVCYDSRCDDGFDLADKELAVLIQQVAGNGAHVVIVLDCCHSGSGTRGVADVVYGGAKQAPDQTHPRPLAKFLNGYFEQAENRQSGLFVPAARHILLAACDRKEEARELMSASGVFSHCLLKVLEQDGWSTYAELYKKVQVEVLKITSMQSPQFETYGFFNGFDGFLGLATQRKGFRAAVYCKDGQWHTNLGVLHGLPLPGAGRAEFLISTAEGDVPARTTRVALEESALDTSLGEHQGELQEWATYDAQLVSLPVLPKLIRLNAAPIQAQEILKAMAIFKPISFVLEPQPIKSRYLVRLREKELQIVRQSDGTRLYTFAGNDWQRIFRETFLLLEQICNWEQRMKIDNEESRLNRDDIELILCELNASGQVVRQTASPEAIINIVRQGSEKPRVPFRLELRNNNPYHARHCTLYYASENYGFHHIGFNDTIGPKQTVIAVDRNPQGGLLAFQLSDTRKETDIFKLFVSLKKVSNPLAIEVPGFAVGGQKVYELGAETLRSAAVAGTRSVTGLGIAETWREEDEWDWYVHTLEVEVRLLESKVDG